MRDVFRQSMEIFQIVIDGMVDFTVFFLNGRAQDAEVPDNGGLPVLGKLLKNF